VPSDPDALWKPGFAGEVVYPTRDPVPTPHPARRRRGWRVVGVIAAPAVIAVVATVMRWRSDEAAAAVAEPRLPTGVTTRWSVALPGQVWDLTVSDDVVLAAAHGSQLRIAALAADTGAELWSRHADQAALAAVGVLGDTALFLSSPTRGDDDLVGIDVHTGTERWRRPQPTKDSTVLVEDHHVVVTRTIAAGQVGAGVGDLAGVDLIDPHDGSIRASIDGPAVDLGRTEVTVREGDTFDVYDLDTFERTAHVTIPALGGAAAALVVTPHGVVAVSSDRARLLGADSRVIAEVALDPTPPITAPTAFAFGGHVGALVGKTLTVLQVDEGRLGTAWSRDALVVDGAFAARPLLAIAPADADDQAVADVPIDVVDATTGEPVWSGHALMPSDGPILTASGFVATAPDGDESIMFGVDPAGRTLWTQPVGRAALTTIGAGALLEVRPTPGDATSSTVTLLR
jgi:outer membrane protein assembly factor BamB